MPCSAVPGEDFISSSCVIRHHPFPENVHRTCSVSNQQKEKTMKKASLLVLTLAVALTTAPAALRADDSKKSEAKESKATENKEVKAAKDAADQAAMQKEAKITMDEAKAIALKKVPGKIESGELEREHGKLIYS